MRNTCTLLVIILFVLPIYAQNFEGGIMGGLTACQVDGDNLSGFNKVGFQGGGFVSFDFNDRMAAQLEIKYMGKGARNPTSSKNPDIYKLNLHYIDFPVCFRYMGYNKVDIEIGLEPGYLFTLNGENNDGIFDEYTINGYKDFDLAWLLGISYHINDFLKVGMRYSYSMFSISSIPHDATQYSWLARRLGYTVGDYNNFLSFGVYYQIY